MIKNPSYNSIQIVKAVRQKVAEHLAEHLELLQALVNIDSGKDSPDGIRAVQERIAQSFSETRHGVEWQQRNEVSHLRINIPGVSGRIVVLGHADTVFNRGTVAIRPYRTEGNIAYGPGVVDMKGGLVLALAALRWLIDNRIPCPTIDFIVVGDEETRTSPPPYIDQTQGAQACLVLECGRPGGGIVVSRKAGIWARLHAAGHAAHAGTEPEKGSNAILALCQEVSRISALDAARADLSLVVGKVAGGSAINVVPEKAEAYLDIRSPCDQDLDWIVTELNRFAKHPGIHLEVQTDMRWPAMRSDQGRPVAEIYQNIAAAVGVSVEPISTGGMSDGNWFSQTGIPTIDGLGPVGGLDHGPDEYMEIDSLPDRAGLLAETIVLVGQLAGKSKG